MKWTIESEVRTYCRTMPAIFVEARNAIVFDERGHEYIDLLAGCGSLNYGHNHPALKSAVLAYLASDGISMAMDLDTVAKRRFLQALGSKILSPRGLDYRVQFTGPTGANAVEAALKLARKVTGRSTVVAFENGFHGMSLGALSCTTNPLARGGAGVPLEHVVRLPFDPRSGHCEQLAAFAAQAKTDGRRPAAFIVETVQGEGGLNVASRAWLQQIAAVASDLGALLIVDDIQAGCGRTGPFFSFERAGIAPDIVCLAKSISGLGLPLAMVLLKPEHDVWKPGEHNGTFRSNGLALVSATAAIALWDDEGLTAGATLRSAQLARFITQACADYPTAIAPKGLGLMQGLAFADPQDAAAVQKEAIDRRLLIERCGPFDEVVKIMPPLSIEQAVLDEALGRLRQAVDAVMSRRCAVGQAAE